ncbi:MAG TPA: ankyrin repeat domain-containing protein [Pyrinomonadaceae bacterium]|nr:ankyrin repeat domain-containing protein [Pyrinomonadaceae bacterium]
MLLPKILLLSLAVLLPLQTATNSKQELNEQLFEAVRKGDVAAVTAALDRGADVNAKFRYGTTALFKAAERGYVEVTKVLLDRGADVKVEDTFYHATAFSWALDGKHVEVIKLLLQKGGGDVDDLLITGVRESSADLVKVALDNGGATAPTLTAALALSATDEKNAAITEMLKKAGAQPPLEVDAATLQTYAGTYRGDPGPEVSVSVKEGKLFATFGRDAYQLMALDKTTFRPIAFSGATIAFNSEAGKITGATLKDGRGTAQLKRVEPKQ